MKRAESQGFRFLIEEAWGAVIMPRSAAQIKWEAIVGWGSIVRPGEALKWIPIARGRATADNRSVFQRVANQVGLCMRGTAHLEEG